MWCQIKRPASQYQKDIANLVMMTVKFGYFMYQSIFLYVWVVMQEYGLCQFLYFNQFHFTAGILEIYKHYVFILHLIQNILYTVKLDHRQNSPLSFCPRIQGVQYFGCLQLQTSDLLSLRRNSSNFYLPQMPKTAFHLQKWMPICGRYTECYEFLVSDYGWILECIRAISKKLENYQILSLSSLELGLFALILPPEKYAYLHQKCWR